MTVLRTQRSARVMPRHAFALNQVLSSRVSCGYALLRHVSAFQLGVNATSFPTHELILALRATATVCTHPSPSLPHRFWLPFEASLANAAGCRYCELSAIIA